MTTKPTSTKAPALNLEELNVADLRKLADFLNESGLEEMEIELGEAKLRLKRPSLHAPMAAPAPVLTVAAPAQSAAATAPEPTNTFKSPMVGTFYRASGPEAAPFVKEGDTVKQGQVLCIIEAMKTMNQIEATAAGKVQKVLVENGQPVEFGQPLFVIA